MKSLGEYKPYGTMYVDAMNLMYRSYFGMPMLEYKGHKTGMLLGVSRLVIDWRKRNPGLKIIFIWEGRDGERKHILFTNPIEHNRMKIEILREIYFVGLI